MSLHAQIWDCQVCRFLILNTVSHLQKQISSHRQTKPVMMTYAKYKTSALAAGTVTTSRLLITLTLI